jgi:hypothetical protein
MRMNQPADVFMWNLHQDGKFTVCSLYLALINNGVAHVNRQLWRLKVPLKIKIFMWYMRKEVVITKDNLGRRNWGVANNVAFVYGMSLFNTCFLSVIMRDSFGDYFKLLSASHHRIMFSICLPYGYIRLGEN